jgi:4-diphosphocytidyl-2-C-methyl-D-erythritol kinase
MPDGYHNMKMVMQTVRLCDEISVECVPGEGVRVKPGLPYLPGDERNIAAKAALAFYRHTGISGVRTSIEIEKRIPVGAGLGGGSSDGACILRTLNDMFETGLSMGQLEEIGLTIGSDVPFCVAGGTSLAEGRGEKLKSLPVLPGCHIVICKPHFSFSTPELFKRIVCEKISSRPDTKGIIAALNNGDLAGVARRMYNVFEDVLPKGSTDVADIKSAMLDYGALGVVMTGSGPAVFGLFDNEVGAIEAHRGLSERFKECFLTEPVGKIWEMES